MHRRKLARALHEAFPEVTRDATVKIEHIVRYPGHVEAVAETGCLFLISAVESIDDRILASMFYSYVAAGWQLPHRIPRERGAIQLHAEARKLRRPNAPVPDQPRFAQDESSSIQSMRVWLGRSSSRRATPR